MLIKLEKKYFENISPLEKVFFRVNPWFRHNSTLNYPEVKFDDGILFATKQILSKDILIRDNRQN